jgi:hypothetical protein
MGKTWPVMTKLSYIIKPERGREIVETESESAMKRAIHTVGRKQGLV